MTWSPLLTSKADAPEPTGSPCASRWDGGWHTGAVHLPSPNFGPRPAATDIDLIVVHSISLPPGQYGGTAVQALFTNTLDWDAHPYYQSIRGLQVSTHFYIQRNGDVWQFVDCGQRAWHAGASCYRGRGQCPATRAHGRFVFPKPRAKRLCMQGGRTPIAVPQP